MSNEQNTSSGERASAGRGAPQEIHAFIDHIANCFEVPENVRQHFVNSRVEFLKGLRAVIDHRIEKLSSQAQQASHIAVE